jgi:chitodextrinase
VVLVPDADSATSGCAYTIGADNQPANSAPEITSVTLSTGSKAAKVGQAVTFTAAATDADGDQLTYSWDFGDGTTAAGDVAQHSYAGAGAYRAVVTVSDGGDTATQAVLVTVKGKPGR